jgi:Zn-dependent peptidase ImmA (M78 family)
LRFEAARFLSEEISAPQRESWLPATDTSTARQKAQRAFAAEFLCPIGALRQFLSEDFSPEAIEEAGERFGVSELAVKSVLANHGEIPIDWVTV